ncbi:MAG: Smr/MutS family protein [Flavobacteriaceae bacterium]|jgi:DNA-nicking Smr family endonuclease|nr:Smr/MutS family protein [Flavobacteriaceae bacterium]
MKVGDQVRVVDEDGTFTIKRIEKNYAILIDPYGFEHTHPLKRLVPHVLLEELYNNSDEIVVKYEDKEKKKERFQSRKKEEVREIDLHIGHLVDYVTDLQPHQMLQKQLDRAKMEIDKAKEDRIKKLILIHGKGKGVLKAEVYKLLESVGGIEYFEADIIKYRFGAVEIRFK